MRPGAQAPRDLPVKVGDVVGLELVGVPIADIDALALKRSSIAVGLLTLLFAGVLGPPALAAGDRIRGV